MMLLHSFVLSICSPLYLSPTEQLCLEVNSQTKDEGPTHDGQPGQQPQPLCQTHSPLLGELHLQQHHGALPCADQNQEGRDWNGKRMMKFRKH